jgi:hypothetical protein
MVGRQKYYCELRATFLLRAVFAWLILESHDKGCAQRLFGTLYNRPTPRQSWFPSVTANIWDTVVALGMQAVQIVRGSFFRDSSKRTASGISEADILKSGWTGYILENLPRQTDDASCGVFMVSFAELVLRGWLPPYALSQNDIPRMRLLIAARLLGLVGLDSPPMGSHLFAVSAPPRHAACHN